MKKNCVIPTLIFVFATILCLNKNSAAQSVDRPIHSVEEAKLIVSGNYIEILVFKNQTSEN